jgi:hypothetical protein
MILVEVNVYLLNYQMLDLYASQVSAKLMLKLCIGYCSEAKLAKIASLLFAFFSSFNDQNLLKVMQLNSCNIIL